ncbi:MAG: hypothetical protein AAF620_17155 [Bacteroidota bacterium]
MKIDKELLRRYGSGLCSEEERKAIEEWLKIVDDPSTRFKSFKGIEESKKNTLLKLSGLVPQLESYISSSNTRVVPLHRSVARYAAAACILLVTFLGGRFSAGTANANPAPEDLTADHLFFNGSNGANGSFSGDSFKVQFDGIVKLYNNGFSTKIIQVGDTSFILESHKHYYLSGDAQNPKIRDYSYSSASGNEQPESLVGYFSILRTDK